jgi:hypothetical protein
MKRGFWACLILLAAGCLVVRAQITLLTYNVEGNGATNWSTNAPQVQAIGRELVYLNPDIITFNEIPSPYLWQMTNWVKAFPGLLSGDQFNRRRLHPECHRQPVSDHPLDEPSGIFQTRALRLYR